MKMTDFALIFIAIMIPIVIVVYVDISFLLKAEEERLYYINVINSAINDATHAMKAVETEEQDVDYGYSGISEKRVSVNARVAVETFFNSLYNKFEIDGDQASEAYLKTYVPALAVVDYNGVYIYSIEEYTNAADDGYKGEKYTEHVLKPKRYFTYSYEINLNNGTFRDQDSLVKSGSTNISSTRVITVQFTMDDYITVINQDGTQTSFYLEDNNNNSVLYGGNVLLKEQIIKHLKVKRSQVIAQTVSREMSVAVNKHNYYSNSKYTFTFPEISVSDWQQVVDNVGIIAFIQGINIGNMKLDYVAHGISGLKVTDRYYVSVPNGAADQSLSYYHVTEDCSMYKSQMKPITGYYIEKKDAATLGYYPCPICNP